MSRRARHTHTHTCIHIRSEILFIFYAKKQILANVARFLRVVHGLFSLMWTCKFSIGPFPSCMLNRFIFPPPRHTPPPNRPPTQPEFLSKYLLFDDALHTPSHILCRCLTLCTFASVQDRWKISEFSIILQSGARWGFSVGDFIFFHFKTASLDAITDRWLGWNLVTVFAQKKVLSTLFQDSSSGYVPFFLFFFFSCPVQRKFFQLFFQTDVFPPPL